MGWSDGRKWALSHFARKAHPVGGWKGKRKSSWKRKRAWVKDDVVASLAQDGNRLAADSHKRL